MDLQTLGTAFGLVFLMEFGDKTQLAVLSLTARTGRPNAVFAGAALGLAAVTLIGVTLGTVAATFVPGEWLTLAAAVVFLSIGLFVLASGLRDGRETQAQQPLSIPRSRRALGVAAGTFALLFVAEMGDKTQLAVVGLAAQTGAPWPVFLGAVAALTLGTLLAVWVGRAVIRVVPLRWVTIGAGVIFVALGALMLAGAF
jgi:Ca2+/H+ antiporter, TMEM165/GDT1 family